MWPPIFRAHPLVDVMLIFYTKKSLIQSKKIRRACMRIAQRPKSIRRELDNSFGGLINESRRGGRICTMSIHGFASHLLPSTSSFTILRKRGRPSFVTFATRMLCTKPVWESGLSSTRTNESVYVNDGKGINLLKVIVSDKHGKLVKAIAAQGRIEDGPKITIPCQVVRNSILDCGISPRNNVARKYSINALSRDAEQEKSTTQSLSSPKSVEEEVQPQTEPKSKHRPRNKKHKKKLSETQSSLEALPLKGSREVTRSNDPSPNHAENSSLVDISEEVTNLPCAPQAAFKKKLSKSRKKGKLLKGDDSKEKVNGVSHEHEKVEEAASTGKSPQKAKPMTINGSKLVKLKPLYPPTGKSVLVVESLTKAKVIQKYLGDMYEVLPSHGHVRDLAARSGSVRPDDDFSMVWEVPSSAWTHLKSMKVAIRGADNLILASDPDREGEAVAWHIIEMLRQQNALRNDLNIARVVFQEITESAIKNALLTPRDIDINLVHAYLARRALDYLIGFNVSPLLWRKLPGCQSAGRVQSAALSLICDRELEIEEFKPQEYWSVEATFSSSATSVPNKSSLRSYLSHFDSKKLNQFSIGSETEAKSIEQIVSSSNFKVTAVKRTKANKNPPTPYITSTLQQDAANKLNFSVAYTMKLAQKLYQGIELADGKVTGLITYMRTDGVNISSEATKEICSLVRERYGLEFAANTPRNISKKVKNSQEAHEAIRPTDIRRLPSMLVGALDEDSLKLYTLIWARTMACQMEAAIVDQIRLDIGNDSGSIAFRAACTMVGFTGFRSVYEDTETQAIRANDTEVPDRDACYKNFSSFKRGDTLCLHCVETKQHHTQPPPRYSEASLVKKMEELGIGRPSTYASILKVLLDRKYVIAKSQVLFPEFRGRMVSGFLSHYFNEVTDYSFTADLENELDNVSTGLTEWKGLLKDYWSRFNTYCERASKVDIRQIEKMLERTYENFLFSSIPDESRACPSCLEGTLTFKVNRYCAGYFIGCDQHPKCKFIAKTLYGEEDEDESAQEDSIIEEPKVLGTHPVSGEKILLKDGPFGSYVQLGEDRKGYLPKRTCLPTKDLKSITLDDAIDLLRYPITLGNHPVDGLPVVIKTAQNGFTIRHRRIIAPVPKGMSPNDIDLKKAVELLSSKNSKSFGRPKGKKREEVVDDI